MKDQNKAYLLTGMVITFWATAASAFKIALRFVTPYTLLFYSVLVSSIALFIILTAQKKLGQLARMKRQELALAALLGFLNPFLYYVVLFKAYSVLPGQIAMALNYGWPLVLTLLSVPILKQRLTGIQIFAVIVSFLGAVIIATRGKLTGFGDLNSLGVFLAAGSTVIWASFWLLNARDRRDPVVKLFSGFCFGLLFTLLFSPFAGGLILPEARAFAPLVYVGLFEMGITFVLWLTALQLTSSAAKIGILIYITPFFSLLMLRLAVGEQIHPATFIGLVMIVGSILYQGLRSKAG